MDDEMFIEQISLFALLCLALNLYATQRFSVLFFNYNYQEYTKTKWIVSLELKRARINRPLFAFCASVCVFVLVVWWGYSIDGHKLGSRLKMKEYNRIKCEQFDFLAPIASPLNVRVYSNTKRLVNWSILFSICSWTV